MVHRDTVQLTDQQRLVRESIRNICADFDAEYWREKDDQGEYPQRFVDELADNGWFGVLLPEEYNGAGMGTKEVVVEPVQETSTGKLRIYGF